MPWLRFRDWNGLSVRAEIYCRELVRLSVNLLAELSAVSCLEFQVNSLKLVQIFLRL